MRFNLPLEHTKQQQRQKPAFFLDAYPTRLTRFFCCIFYQLIQVFFGKKMKRPKNPAPIKEEELDSELCKHSAPKKNIKQEDELKCELCSATCSSISELQSHTLTEHLPDRKPSFPTNNSHRVSCQQCEDTFESFVQFVLHMKTHITTANAQIFFCPICPAGASFRDKKSQLDHLTTQHLQMQVTQFLCSECDTAFSSMQLLSAHFSESHRKFMCTSCDFIADNDKLFKEHSKIHCRHIVMYGCAICGTAYSSQQNLLTHVQLSHDQDSFYSSPLSSTTPTAPSPKPIPKPRILLCSVCDEKVVGEDGLDEHRLQKHCKIRYSDKCADCQELLLNESNFVDHCLRHAKDHNHHCPVCRQSLRSDAQINAHCAYHMNMNPSNLLKVVSEDTTSSGSSSPTNNTFSFVCPICGEKLDDGFALIEHSKKHL